MIDFALDAERRTRGELARRDLRGLPAALPPDPDDDAGGAARRDAAGARQRRRGRAAPSARHRDRRRPDREPGADPLHDAGRVSLPRPLQPVGAAACGAAADRGAATAPPRERNADDDRRHPLPYRARPGRRVRGGGLCLVHGRAGLRAPGRRGAGCLQGGSGAEGRRDGARAAARPLVGASSATPTSMRWRRRSTSTTRRSGPPRRACGRRRRWSRSPARRALSRSMPAARTRSWASPLAGSSISGAASGATSKRPPPPPNPAPTSSRRRVSRCRRRSRRITSCCACRTRKSACCRRTSRGSNGRCSSRATSMPSASLPAATSCRRKRSSIRPGPRPSRRPWPGHSSSMPSPSWSASRQPTSASPQRALNVAIPTVPPALPSELLVRRPDIAAAERRMAAANAQIGVAEAAFYPSARLFAGGGFDISFAGGVAYALALLDGGLRDAQSAQYTAAYAETVADYRQTVLSALRDVEDNLAALRLLESEAAVQGAAVKAARESVTITNNQYRAGTVTYLVGRRRAGRRARQRARRTRHRRPPPRRQREPDQGSGGRLGDGSAEGGGEVGSGTAVRVARGSAVRAGRPRWHRRRAGPRWTPDPDGRSRQTPPAAPAGTARGSRRRQPARDRGRVPRR